MTSGSDRRTASRNVIPAPRPNLSGAGRLSNEAPAPPLFSGDDYQLVAEAICREEDRRELFRRLHGIDAPADDQLDRLAELARRLAECLRRTGQL